MFSTTYRIQDMLHYSMNASRRYSFLKQPQVRDLFDRVVLDSLRIKARISVDFNKLHSHPESMGLALILRASA
jgi:hypothetical protein